MTKLNRRLFLSAAGATAATGILPRFASGTAQAANTSGYRALVCLFFAGGLDGHDCVLPYDLSSYDQLTNIRGNYFNNYSTSDSRARSNLTPLNVRNASNFGTRQFAFSPNMEGMRDLFDQGRLAVVGNVGPLENPMNRETYLNGSVQRPPRLFSHNDQRSIWRSLEPEGARLGWGGQIADLMLEANANPEPAFTCISVGNTPNTFLSGNMARAYKVGSEGVIRNLAVESTFLLFDEQKRENLRQHLRDVSTSRQNLFERDFAATNRRAIDANGSFASAFTGGSPLNTSFPESRLGQDLATVANVINRRIDLNVSRQIFYVGVGGFDTHSRQAIDLPRLQDKFSDAIRSFYLATEEMGIAQDVTLFTMSDFGRGLVANGDGTDHGWGNHQYVVGGAVDGGRIIGDVPSPTLEHSQDVGRGQLIPTTSIEQFAAPLARWFGLSGSEVNSVFPSLNRFGPEADIFV